ncbi:hypothetical protein pEaSNUABM36_00317 [Erwinia phage pEa_SNUABM_36]|nr:hypothetical protein pEaSNUABM36_00317 [Erwinia phage pEa_SNUABM_36]
MARIETNTNLVGKTIVLLNGTKAKIEDAIASGYKVKGQTKRIATRCVIKEGAHFKEIERMNMSQLEDTGEGYVKLKDAKAAKASTKKPSAKEKAPKAGKKAAQPAKEKEPKVRRKSSKEKEDEYQDLAHAIIKGGKRAAPVEIAEIDGDLTDCVAQRLVDVLNNSEVAKLCADNKTPIANAIEVTYGAEFAPETNVMQITLSLQYAKPVQTLSRPTLENAEAIALRAEKMAAPKLSMKLKKAIREAFSLEDANDLELGTVLLSDGAEFVYFGESAKHVGKALLYVVETDKFKSVLGSTLGEYEIPDAEEEEEEEEEVEDESEEEEEEDGEEEDGEEEDGEEEDGEEDSAEYDYVAVNKDQLDMVNKKVTAKYHAALAERFNTTEEVLIPGLVLTDGETTFAYLGCDSKGGLLVIDCGDDGEGEDVLMYSKSDIKSLDDFNPVMGEADEDGEESDGGEESDDEDLDEEDGEEEEEDGEDDDFDFDDVPEADIEDLTEDELRDRVVEAGLTTPRKAENMNEAKLRKLLKSA